LDNGPKNNSPYDATSITTGISADPIASIFAAGGSEEVLVEIASTDRRDEAEAGSDMRDTGGGSDRRDEFDAGEDVADEISVFEVSVAFSLDLLVFSLFG
jgi:hypothetical protein